MDCGLTNILGENSIKKNISNKSNQTIYWILYLLLSEKLLIKDICFQSPSQSREAVPLKYCLSWVACRHWCPCSVWWGRTLGCVFANFAVLHVAFIPGELLSKFCAGVFLCNTRPEGKNWQSSFKAPQARTLYMYTVHSVHICRPKSNFKLVQIWSLYIN